MLLGTALIALQTRTHTQDHHANQARACEDAIQTNLDQGDRR
jgi:hypothetical protein